MNTKLNIQLSPIEAHERNIDKIFSDDYAFEIPPYQRPYAWEKEQAGELLSDLFDAMGNKNENGGTYFLGSIVLIKDRNDPLSFVVDGQQRLTTLTILLSVLRDLSDDDEVKSRRCGYIYQKADEDRGTSERCRLRLREQDQSFFCNHIQKLGATGNTNNVDKHGEPQIRIIENAIYFINKLSEKSDAQRSELFRFIIQNCYLVVVAVPTPEAAMRIFTVLNARGMDLKPTDILKADMLQRAERGSEENLAREWEKIEEQAGRDKFAELFGHIRMIYERDKPRTALEKGFAEHVAPFRGDAKIFMSETLGPISDAFVLLYNFDEIRRNFGYDAAKAVRSLGRIDNKDWIPPVLLRLWKRQGSDQNDVKDFLIKLERLAYYLFAIGANVNERIKRFSEVIEYIDPRKPTVPNRLELEPAEQKEFIEKLSGPLYKNHRICKPVLQRLDEALSTGGATYDSLVSIEHVLPQNVDAGSEWADLYPIEDIREEWTHRLANLVFLTRRINSSASNWGFETKKKKYFCSADGISPFPLTQGVLGADAWTLEHLKQRQESLLKKLCEIWDLKPE